jgi:phosphoribosylanthranilate isomerase
LGRPGGGGAPPRVKICGLTRLEDALAAVRLGADALGFNFWPGSKRYLAPAAAREIIRALPPLVTTVGVFVDPTRDEAMAAAAVSGVQVLQLHGDEPPEACARLPLPVLKAIRVGGPEALALLDRYAGAVAGFLLDADSAGYGGSGQTFDWGLAALAAARAPVVLAGGLTPANVAEAVRAVHPWGVDVASGVESAPGLKDLHLVSRFIRAAKEQP